MLALGVACDCENTQPTPITSIPTPQPVPAEIQAEGIEDLRPIELSELSPSEARTARSRHLVAHFALLAFRDNMFRFLVYLLTSSGILPQNERPTRILLGGWRTEEDDDADDAQLQVFTKILSSLEKGW
jgi:hypothetical protein